MKQNKKKKLVISLIVGLLVLLVLAGVYMVQVHLPISEEQEKLIAQQQQLEEQLVLLESKYELQQQMESHLAMQKEQDSEVMTPDYDNLQLLMNSLHQMLLPTNSYELRFGASIPDEEDKNIFRREVNLQFTASSYEKATGIIAELEQCPYRCQLTEVRIVPENSMKKNVAVTDGAVEVAVKAVFFERIAK